VKHNARLEIECIPKPTQERQGDEYIMDVVCSPTMTTELDTKQLRHYTDAEIRTTYYCKSYLQVKRLSDLCTADGIFVLPSIAKGERSIRKNVSRLISIKQDRPGEPAWRLWRKFLRTICKEKEEEKTNNNLYDSHTTSETEVGILTLDSEYDGINPTINMAGMASYSLPTIDYCGCSTRLLTLLNTDLIFRSVLFWCRYIYWNCNRNTSISSNAKGCY
jgi:hypothetical protein